jgi:hypothetical protein
LVHYDDSESDDDDSIEDVDSVAGGNALDDNGIVDPNGIVDMQGGDEKVDEDGGNDDSSIPPLVPPGNWDSDDDESMGDIDSMVGEEALDNDGIADPNGEIGIGDLFGERVDYNARTGDDDSVGSDELMEAFGLYNGDGFSRRSGDPINEFTDRRILQKAFPVTFMLGQAYPYKGVNLGSREFDHLLHQFTNVPAEDFRLLGYLQKTRTKLDVMTSVVAHVNSNPYARQELYQLLTDEKRQEELRKAIEDPTSKIAKEVERKYFSHVKFSGKDVDAGKFSTLNLKSMIMEDSKRFVSLPQSFVTLSFTNIDNPRTLRATFYTVDNDKFPAVFDGENPFAPSSEEFIANLKRTATEVETRVFQGKRIDRSSRSACQMSNPVACVDECKRILADVCGILFGVPLEHFFSRDTHSERKTWCFTCRKGVMGYGFAIVGVTEGHAKGTLHFHLIF